ncbi:TadE/TadG family type IV pilus assembly protein [Rhizobium sp. 'Codium 1']|nr:TadE/TadG family type IV pilus assembly protein [Rhizobium sp. 'Codium 1']
MMTKPDRQKKSIVSRFLSDRAGNFGITTAIIIPVVAATAGVAMDYNRMVQVRAALQDSADSAVLSAANALAKNDNLSDEAALELARKFMKAQFYNVVPGASGDSSDIPADEDPLAGAVGNVERKSSSSGKTFDVTLSTSYVMPTNGLTGLLGWKEVTLGVTASAQATTESKNALSMYLVLDRSGSMAWDTTMVNEAQPTKTVYYSCGNKKTCSYQATNYVVKIDALKLAVANLTTQLTTADPESKYVRTAAVAYEAKMYTPASFNWGSAHTLSYVQALVASGGTDSSDAMARAYTDVIKSSEDTAHKNKNGQVPSKFIVFMTDGDNNQSSADTKTKATCESAKKAGVEIFTVAFMAPSKGQALLEYCATSTSHYYDAQDAAELVAAFKEIGDKAVQASTRLTN